MKIAEAQGHETNGYGESLIKYYAEPSSFHGDSYYIALHSGGKKRGKLVVDSLSKLVQIQEILGTDFRVVK